jgi:hypothetical protein
VITQVAGPTRRPRANGRIAPVPRLLTRNPVLRDTTVMLALFNIGEGALLVLPPRRALEYGLGTGGYGYQVAAMTGGELIVALVPLRRPWRASLTRSIVYAALFAAAAAMTTCAQTLRMATAPPETHGSLRRAWDSWGLVPLRKE